MSAEVKKEIQLEIGHVLFIDIVGYSKLLINEQSEHMQTLREIVRAAWAGEKELALQQLETGLRAPMASLMLSYGALRLLPFWDPLRGDPRFEKIVASLAPKQ